jgi:hypothetical protein
MDRIETVKNHFEKEAEEFDKIILIGYKNIDVVWKYYSYCVYGGYK